MAIDGTHLDPTARSVWVDLYKIGSDVIFTAYTDEGIREKVVTVTPEFVAKMMASFDALTAEGDRVTVLKEHKVDGDHYGTAHELRIDGEWIQARLSFVPSIWAAYDDQRVVEFSPGFVTSMKNAHTGEIFENVLLEVTITAMALQHTLRPPQETNARQTLVERMLSGSLTFAKGIPVEEEKEQPAVETPEEEEEEPTELDAANARIAELEASLQAMKDKYEGEEEEAASLAASLQERIVALEDEVVMRDLAAASVPAEHFAHLLKLKRVDASLFDASVANLSVPDKQAPIGSTGVAPIGSTTGAADILKLAASAGVSYTNGLTAWLYKNHPEQLGEVVAIARNQKDSQ